MVNICKPVAKTNQTCSYFHTTMLGQKFVITYTMVYVLFLIYILAEFPITLYNIIYPLTSTTIIEPFRVGRDL